LSNQTPRASDPAPAAGLRGRRKKQTRTLPTFLGPLATPIRLPEKQGLAGAATEEQLGLFVRNIRLIKLAQLAEAYGCLAGDKYDWLSLCLALANDFVPGFKVDGPTGDPFNGVTGRGRPKRDLSEDAEMVLAIVLHMRRNETNLKQACQDLCRKDNRYYGKKPKTLEAVYYKHQRDPVPLAISIARSVVDEA
jgi:hypothetical protein